MHDDMHVDGRKMGRLLSANLFIRLVGRRWPGLYARLAPLCIHNALPVLNEVTGLDVKSTAGVHDTLPLFLARLEEMDANGELEGYKAASPDPDIPDYQP